MTAGGRGCSPILGVPGGQASGLARPELVAASRRAWFSKAVRPLVNPTWTPAWTEEFWPPVPDVRRGRRPHTPEKCGNDPNTSRTSKPKGAADVWRMASRRATVVPVARSNDGYSRPLRDVASSTLETHRLGSRRFASRRSGCAGDTASQHGAAISAREVPSKLLLNRVLLLLPLSADVAQSD